MTLGTYIVTYDVLSDVSGNSTSQVTRTVEVVEFSPPSIVLNPIGDQFIESPEELTFTAAATDNDSTSTTQVFTLDTAATNIGASIDPSTGVFSWTPTADQGLGIYTIVVTVTNNGITPLSDSEEFKIIVNTPSAILLELHDGWNLISLPKQPRDNRIETIFGNRVASVVWGWDGATKKFKVVSKVTQHKGFWVYSNNDFLNQNAVIINLL